MEDRTTKERLESPWDRKFLEKLGPLGRALDGLAGNSVTFKKPRIHDAHQYGLELFGRHLCDGAIVCAEIKVSRPLRFGAN